VPIDVARGAAPWEASGSYFDPDAHVDTHFESIKRTLFRKFFPALDLSEVDAKSLRASTCAANGAKKPRENRGISRAQVDKNKEIGLSRQPAEIPFAISPFRAFAICLLSLLGDRENAKERRTESENMPKSLDT